MSRLLNSYWFVIAEDDDDGGGEQGIGPDFVEPGVLYTQPPGGGVDFIEEG